MACMNGEIRTFKSGILRFTSVFCLTFFKFFGFFFPDSQYIHPEKFRTTSFKSSSETISITIRLYVCYNEQSVLKQVGNRKVSVSISNSNKDLFQLALLYCVHRDITLAIIHKLPCRRADEHVTVNQTQVVQLVILSS